MHLSSVSWPNIFQGSYEGSKRVILEFIVLMRAFPTQGNGALSISSGSQSREFLLRERRRQLMEVITG